jgi:hypothetical protein
MAKLKIAGVPPLDGDYDLDISAFTNRELHTIKEIAGVRAGELKAAMEASDNDLVVAFAVIVLRRAGKQVHPDQLWDAELGAISFEVGETEVVERPPVLASPSGIENGPADSDAPNGSMHPSGASSSDGGDQPPNHLSPIGPPGSATSMDFDPMTSAT